MIPQRQKQKTHTTKPEEAPPCSGVFFVASKAVGSSRWAKLLRSAFEPAACTDVNFSLAKYTFHNEPSTTKPVAAGGSCLMQRVQKFSERPTICPIAQRGFSVSAYPSSSERVLAFRDPPCGAIPLPRRNDAPASRRSVENYAGVSSCRAAENRRADGKQELHSRPSALLIIGNYRR